MGVLPKAKGSKKEFIIESTKLLNTVMFPEFSFLILLGLHPHQTKDNLLSQHLLLPILKYSTVASDQLLEFLLRLVYKYSSIL